MNNLKLLTLNLHCLEEENLALIQKQIADKIIELDIDIIFLQEVAQTQTKNIILDNIKEDNYGYQLQKLLKAQQKIYDYNYEALKYSFGKYDEGLAILSKYPLSNKKVILISKTSDPYNWKLRKALKVDIKDSISLYCTHLGWSDGTEVFEDQVDLMVSDMNKDKLNIIAGDFNIIPNSNEYRHIVKKRLYDLFYDNNPLYWETPTHISNMDIHAESKRIDYIFSSKKLKVNKRMILFNEQRVSDHFGVYLEIEV